MTVGLQFGSERGKVFDNSVVHNGNPSGRIEVRVRVAVVGGAMGSTPRVTDASVCLGQRMGGQLGIEIEQFAGFLRRRDGAVMHECDPAGVITAVFQPPQTPHDHLERRALTHVSDDSAHAH